jgi:hypothetical protein
MADPQSQVANDSPPVVIVGAGAAGLAVAYTLDKAGVDYDIFDAGPGPGESWARRYDRLHLHTIKRFSHLPGLEMDEALPRYPSRDQFAAYLRRYAERLSRPIRWNVRLESATRQEKDGTWTLRTSEGEVRAPVVIAATGYNRVPNRPSFPELSRFAGETLHSSEYDNGERFRGQSVLVVGCGNSGAEIAIDLHEHGAEPAMVVRAPTWVTPRDLLGQPSQATTIRFSKLPIGVADAIGKIVLRVAVGDLSRWGIQRPKDRGPLRQIVELGRVPILDIGTVDLIKDRKIRVTPGVKSFFETGVRFVDGSIANFAAVVFATGFRCGITEMFPQLDEVVDDRGYPKTFAGDPVLPGLHLIGFHNVPTGLLRELGFEAEAIARSLAPRFGTAPEAATG